MNLYTNGLLRRSSLVMALAALAFTAGALPASPAVAKQPTATYISVSDGDVFSEPVLFVQMCFSEPIDITDLARGGDFHFELLSPAFALGLRIVFQPDGNGVAVYPGLSPGDTNGEWTFNYRVTSPDTHEALEGTVKYRVDPSGQPVPKATPPACLEGGATPPPGSGATAAPTAKPSPTKSSSVSPSGPAGASASASPGVGGSNNGDSNPDILLLALLTVGAAGGAGVVGLFGYLVRRRVGFWMHKPPPDGPNGDADHH